MTLLGELVAVQQEGFDRTTEAHQKGEVPLPCPYSDADRNDAWQTGCEKAERYIENRQNAEQTRREREQRREAVEEKLEEVFGDRNEFEQWLAAFVDARTR